MILLKQLKHCNFWTTLIGFGTLTLFYTFYCLDNRLFIKNFKFDDELKEHKSELNKTKLYCDDELFAYHHIANWNSTAHLKLQGNRFNCSFLSLLKELKLTHEFKIDEFVQSNYPDDLVFVAATDLRYYSSVKVSFATVRKHFGSKHKFILYDLGGLKEKYDDEISKMCNLEFREFNFTKFPPFIKNLKKFSWKILIVSEVFKEANNIIYLDSSMFFKSNEFNEVFQLMSSKDFKLTPIQVTGFTHHSIKFATNKQMYDYIPLDSRLFENASMYEAGLLLIHKSERTRQVLKWAVLCALTENCIDPPGSKIYCDTNRKNETAICNRQDQSVFNILIQNLEFQLQSKGFPTIGREQKEHSFRKEKLENKRLVLGGQRLKGNEKLSC